jgi:hypothetical protein
MNTAIDPLCIRRACSCILLQYSYYCLLTNELSLLLALSNVRYILCVLPKRMKTKTGIYQEHDEQNKEQMSQNLGDYMYSKILEMLR